MPDATVTPPFFEFRNVCKQFDGVPVLDDISFQVPHGQTLGIIGRSGVGKSVSLKLIMGFLKPDSGQVLIDGVDISGFDEARLTEMHKKITMVFQSGALFDSMTVAENVAFPLERAAVTDAAEVGRVVAQLLEMLDLTPFRDRYPASLSTGMKRAVAIARALAARPQAILYDEPTTMVDPIMAHVISDLIQRVKRQVKLTSVVVTHDIHLARKLADRLVLLHDCHVEFYGTVVEMEATSDPIMREFLRQDDLVLS